MTYKNKKVWITGASSGIGEALAYTFAQEGATLILSARKAAELERVKAHCKGAAAVDIVLLDIGDHNAVFSTVKTTLERHGGSIDVLVNNAGLSQRSLAKDTAFSVDEQMIAVNLLGTIAMTKAVLPAFLAQKSGQIVTISSIMGKLGAPLRSSYAAANGLTFEQLKEDYPFLEYADIQACMLYAAELVESEKVYASAA